MLYFCIYVLVVSACQFVASVPAASGPTIGQCVSLATATYALLMIIGATK